METVNTLVLGLLAVPVIILIYHLTRVDGARPDAYSDISKRPIIPAVIVDVDMPFASLVTFMLKLAVAALPAMILVAVVFVLVFAAMAAAVGVGGRLL